MDNNWNFLLSEFCRVDGIAENILQKDGLNVRGIFPVNPSLKSRIFTPTKLMIKIDHIYLEKKTQELKNMRNILRKLEIFLILSR